MIYQHIGRLLLGEYNKRNNTLYDPDTFFDEVCYEKWFTRPKRMVYFNNFKLTSTATEDEHIKKRRKEYFEVRNDPKYNGDNAIAVLGHASVPWSKKSKAAVNTTTFQSLGGWGQTINTSLNNIGAYLGFNIGGRYTGYLIDRDLLYFIFFRVFEYADNINKHLDDSQYTRLSPGFLTKYISCAIISAAEVGGYDKFDVIKFHHYLGKFITAKGEIESIETVRLLHSLHKLTGKKNLNISIIAHGKQNITVGYVSFNMNNLENTLEKYNTELIVGDKDYSNPVDSWNQWLPNFPQTSLFRPGIENTVYFSNKLVGHDPFGIDELYFNKNYYNDAAKELNRSTYLVVLHKLNNILIDDFFKLTTYLKDYFKKQRNSERSTLEVLKSVNVELFLEIVDSLNPKLITTDFRKKLKSLSARQYRLFKYVLKLTVK